MRRVAKCKALGLAASRSVTSQGVKSFCVMDRVTSSLHFHVPVCHVRVVIMFVSVQLRADQGVHCGYERPKKMDQHRVRLPTW